MTLNSSKTNSAKTLAAVLWDLDGTLVDTEPLWLAAEHELAATFGKSWTQEDGLKLVGNTLLESGIYIRNRLEIDMTPEAIVDYLVDRLATQVSEEIIWRPGARELLKAFNAEGIPQALVTMAYAAIADPIARQLPLDAIVTGDTVSHGKPHPEPYLLAAKMLGVDPSECIAIEDSTTGANSANAAGCQVFVVPHMVNVPVAPRRTFLSTLEGVTPEDLRSLLI